MQFLHADMAFTLARRICDKTFLSSASLGINVADFEYHDPVVKQRNTSDAQPILITADADLDKMEVHVKWFNPAKDVTYCHATVFYENSSSWLTTWSRSAKLVYNRVEMLNDMAATGKASKITADLAYSLFGKLVDYSDMYRTMQSVILNEDEAMAEVLFPPDTNGTWTVPPHFIDGLVSLSGFILNGGTHFDNIKNFFITPSWKSMRFAKPLAPGGRYLAYVRMVPADNHSYVGDVYVLQGSEIVGVVEAILFRQWPRVMLNRFFTPAAGPAKTAAKKPAGGRPAPRPTPAFTPPSSRPASPGTVPRDVQTERSTSQDKSTDSSSGSQTNVKATGIPSRALEMVAEELAVDVGQLTDEAQVADLGLDSLMSLVLSQRLREELGLEIRDAFFLEISTIGDLKKLLR